MARTQAAILSDVAHVRDGLVYILAGGINRIAAPEPPIGTSLVLTVMVELESDELDAAHEMAVTVANADSATVVWSAVGAFQAGLHDHLLPGEPQLLPLTVSLAGLALPEFGTYDVRITLDGTPQQHLTFRCVPL